MHFDVSILFSFFFKKENSDVFYIQNFSEFVSYVWKLHDFPAILGSTGPYNFMFFEFQYISMGLAYAISDDHAYTCIGWSCLCILPLVLVYCP